MPAHRRRRVSRNKRGKQRADSQACDNDACKQRNHRESTTLLIIYGRAAAARRTGAIAHPVEIRGGMIRVPVPIDLGTAITAGASAFASATPIRVATLLELAITRVLGRRAPSDKRDRALRATLAGMRAGTFFLHVDGRLIDDPERIVVCSGGSATVRFFARHRAGIVSSVE